VPTMCKHRKVKIRGTRTRQELVDQVPNEVISVSLQELPRARVLETECIEVVFTLEHKRMSAQRQAIGLSLHSHQSGSSCS
jgi:hypothetical protein